MTLARRSALGLMPCTGLVISLAVIACGDEHPVQGEPEPNPPSPKLSFEIDYSTYLGGSRFEEAREPVLLAGDRLLLGMRTISANSPTTPGAYQTQYAGGDGDTWIGILSSDGRRLEAATFLGGSGMERPPYGMVVTENGEIIVTSGTNSEDLPANSGAYRTDLDSPVNGGYICRLGPELQSRRWCTYTALWPRGGLDLDDGAIVVVGRALDGSRFTATTGAFQTEKRGKDDVAVLGLAADGSEALFKTRLGGSGTEKGEVATTVLLASDRFILTGISQSPDFPTTVDAVQKESTGPRDIFIAWLTKDGSELQYSTLLGGSGQDLSEHRDLLLSDGSVVIGGQTLSTDIAGASGSLNGTSDALLALLSGTGSEFQFVRYLGGSGDDRVVDEAVVRPDRIVVVGESTSSDFPVTEGALQPEYGGGESDGFVAILDATGSLLYSTYLGGEGEDLIRGVALGPAGELYLVGLTSSEDFPVTSGALQTARGGAEDGFAVRLVPDS